MKVVVNVNEDLKYPHSSSNQLVFGNKRARRSSDYIKNKSEMTQLFENLDFNITPKIPLAVGIKYFYPKPKKKVIYPITRSTKDLDSTKAVNDALMQAGLNLNLKRGLIKDQKVIAMFDDSQIIVETLEKYYWDKSSYGLHIVVIEIENGDDINVVKERLQKEIKNV